MKTPIRIRKKDGTILTVHATNAPDAKKLVQVMNDLAAMLPALKALENDIKTHLNESKS
jgi:hypothetical protein